MSESANTKLADALGGQEQQQEDDALERFVEAEVLAAMAPFAGRLPSEQLAQMRDQLTQLVREDFAVSRLARAALPRDGDQSGEIRHRVPREG